MKIFEAKELAEEIHKPIIRSFNKGKAELLFVYNIQGAVLAEM